MLDTHPFVEHFKFVKVLEDENSVAKLTIPAPAQFIEQMIMPFAQENTRKYYVDNRELAEDIAAGYKKFIADVYAAGCRDLQFDDCSWGMLVDPLVCTQKRLSDHHTNSLDQLALAAFLRDGELERHTRRMKKDYRACRDDLTDCLRAQFGPAVHISGCAAGMNLVAAFDGVDCTDALVRRMLQQGAYAVPVEQQAAVKGQHKNELILRHSGLTRDELALGAARLKAAIAPDRPVDA